MPTRKAARVAPASAGSDPQNAFGLPAQNVSDNTSARSAVQDRRATWITQLSTRPDSQIVLCDGAKSATSAESICQTSICYPWDCELTQLAGRKVWVWPNAIASTVQQANEIALQLANLGGSVELVDAFALASVDVEKVSRQPPQGYGPAETLKEHGSAAAEAVLCCTTEFRQPKPK